MEFKDRLKQLRLNKDLSQAELAKRLGLSKSRISMYEIGERQPDFPTLELIADYFNVDLEYLLGKRDVSTYVISPEDKDILRILTDDKELHMLFEKVRDAQYRRRLLYWIELMELYEKKAEEEMKDGNRDTEQEQG